MKLKGSFTVLKPSATIFCTAVAKSPCTVLPPCTAMDAETRAELGVRIVTGHVARLRNGQNREAEGQLHGVEAQCDDLLHSSGKVAMHCIASLHSNGC